jgi:hypothetical protein
MIRCARTDLEILNPKRRCGSDCLSVGRTAYVITIEILLAELMGGVAIGNSNVDVYYFLRSEIKYSYEKVARSKIKYTFV